MPDNLKAAIIKAHKYEPSVNQALEDFANHYNTTVTPARARKPKDKALVENQVRLIYTRVYARLRNQTFFDLYSLNQAIAEKIREHNQTRMQQKDYCREEKYLAEEKQLLAPLPVTRFEVKYYKQLKVARNNHIYLTTDKHYYSVHYSHIGSQVMVIYTRSMVYIYANGVITSYSIHYTKLYESKSPINILSGKSDIFPRLWLACSQVQKLWSCDLRQL